MLPRLHIAVLFGNNGKPSCAAVKLGDEPPQLLQLYRPGTGSSIYDIRQNEKYVRELIVKCSANGIDIVTTGFKRILSHFNLDLYKSQYNVYDLNLQLPVVESSAADEYIVGVVEIMAGTELKDWQKILSNASVVYQAFENRGILHGYKPEHPAWSTETFTGRSKTSGFNLHSCQEDDFIQDPLSPEDYLFVHFDWISADMRIASILSGDEALNDSFLVSDPYTYITDQLNEGADNDLSRDETKLAMLKSINSLDHSNPIFSMIYPKLGAWLSSLDSMVESGVPISTILGRRLPVDLERKKLAYINGVMQGSVAHALQIVIRKVWEAIDMALFTEIHDSIVCMAAPNEAAIHKIIDTVVPIMSRPFIGIKDIDVFFPLKVSIGQKWKQWQFLRTYRDETPKS